MIAVGTKYNLLDVASSKDPSGKLAKVAEIYQQSNPMLEHIPFFEGNLDTGERITARKTLGTPTWRRVNEEVAPSKATVSQVDEVTGMLEDYSEVDEKLVKMALDKEGFLLLQSRAKMEAMAQEMAGTYLYGNIITSPSEFHGFMPRLNTLNSTVGETPIVLAGGGSSTDNNSILYVGWGEGKVYGIYPKGSKAGLEFENLGKVTKETTSGLREVYRSHFIWEAGLAVADPRYVARIANIDISDLATFGSGSDTSANLVNLMIDMLSFIPNPESVNGRIYCPRAVWAGLTKMGLSDKNRNITTAVVDGKFITHFFGVPVHKMDQMTTEAKVS